MFNGEGGPQVTNDWLESIQKHLSMIGVPNKNKIEFVAYKFKGHASKWWQQVKKMYNVDNMTWEQFEVLYNDKCFPQSY